MKPINMKSRLLNILHSVTLLSLVSIPTRGLAADPTNAAPEVIRINAGGAAIKDSSGHGWLADTGFEGGDVIERPDLDITNTKQPELYRSEHYLMDSFSHKLPNGKYQVKLHFCEAYEGVSGPGDRVFTFEVEGKSFKDFDVWAKAGGFAKAYVETVDVDIADGKLDLKFTPQVENPAINGIEIIPAALAHANNAKPTAIRINAGGTAIKDASGLAWLADTGFEGGDVIERPDLDIANTKQPEIYRSEHYLMDSFSHKLPNGKYQVKLHFCETYEGVSGAGDRVFTFDVEGKVFKDFDVWAKAGGFAKAYVETVDVSVTDGKLDIKFTPQVENPQVNAIEIIPGV